LKSENNNFVLFEVVCPLQIPLQRDTSQLDPSCRR